MTYRGGGGGILNYRKFKINSCRTNQAEEQTIANRISNQDLYILQTTIDLVRCPCEGLAILLIEQDFSHLDLARSKIETLDNVDELNKYHLDFQSNQ